MKALIFAAGLGTRLKPLTDNMPKALVPVNGKPLLYHVITKLKAAGISGFVVNVHHFADMIIDTLRDNDGFGVQVSVSDERERLLDTGGGVIFARQLLENEEMFLVHNVDIISNLDIKWFASKVRPEAVSTLAVSNRKTRRYLLFDEEMRLKGWTDIATGEVRTPFENLDTSRCRKLAFAGIHIMNRRIFHAFEDLGFAGKFSIMDFYIKACGRYPIYGVVPEGLEIIDVGKPETLKEAANALKITE